MKKSGFTLVELSIVLVILGLLVGGVLAGQNLIRAAELRSVVTEYTNFQTAVMTFKEKYFALPGDMDNATAFWGEAHATPGTCVSTASTGTETCDGDGDGTINFVAPYTAPTHNEIFRFWQHLANAGLIEGSFKGVPAAAGGYFLGVDTENSPVSKLGNASWSVFKEDSSFTFDYDFAPYSYAIGGVVGSSSWNHINILTPEEAWNIDTKMDDGIAGSGVVTGRVSNECSGTTSGTDFDAEYALNVTDVSCILRFKP